MHAFGFAASVYSSIACAPSSHERQMNSMQYLNSYYDGTLNLIQSSVLVSSSVGTDNDTYTFSQMLKQEDKHEFIKAMMVEIDDHERRGHWTLMILPHYHLHLLQVFPLLRPLPYLLQRERRHLQRELYLRINRSKINLLKLSLIILWIWQHQV